MVWAFKESTWRWWDNAYRPTQEGAQWYTWKHGLTRWTREIAAEGPSYKLGRDGALVLTSADGQEFIYTPPAAPTFSVVDGMLRITYEEEVVPE